VSGRAVLGFSLTAVRGDPLRIMCLGAHADDIEIGCGGTVLRLLAEHPDASVRWIVFSGDGVRRSEAEDAAGRFLNGCRDRAVEVHGFRDGYFPDQQAAIKDVFERLKREHQPALILTHFREDAHQDHRVVCELTWNTFRDHLIWEYEVPKYEGDQGNPNLFVPLPEDIARRKTSAIVEGFPSQLKRPWFTAETFMALMRLRAIGCRAPEGFAEAFYCRKVVL
jgi:LmbE family N-acetylglucosaminyl deacetylase